VTTAATTYGFFFNAGFKIAMLARLLQSNETSVAADLYYIGK
jgi:hypothetical protein